MSDIQVISSMATRRLLADLVAAFAQTSPGAGVVVESVGGVEAAKRVEAGEAFDAVILASGALDKLVSSGRVMRGSRVDLVKSPIAVAVRSGAARPSIASEDDVKRAVLAARTIGYSTGPSGDHLLRVFDRWGIAEAVKGRIVQATPGVPVGALVANGDAELGFQQLSELMNVAGIEVLGLLPEAIQGTTIFSGGVATTSTKPDAVRALLSFMASPAVAHVAREHGMEQAG